MAFLKVLRPIRTIQQISGLPLVATMRNFRPEVCQSDKMTDIGTRRIFTPEHDIFRETVRKFYKEEVVPYTDKWEEDGEISRECWLKAGASGLLGIGIPADKGGIGADWLSCIIHHEEQVYANCSGPGFALHSDVVMPYFINYGTREQIKKYIPDMTAGKIISAIAMTEPNAGSDLQGIRTYAKRDGDDWILNGSKTFITNGYLCDMVIVVALTRKEDKGTAHSISLFIVDGNNPGFKKGRKLKKLGFKAQDTAELFFEDCRVPNDAVLGGNAGLNKGFYQLMRELQQERLMVGNACVAMCEAAFEETRDYVKQRKAFGKRIADLQTIQHSLAELKSEITVARAFADQCNELHNNGKLDTSTASMVKYLSSDLVVSVTSRCLQMFGGWGYMWEYPMARRFADARLQPIYAGSNEIMKELIARDIVQEK